MADCYKVTWLFKDIENFNPAFVLNKNLKSLCMRHTYITDESGKIKFIIYFIYLLSKLDNRNLSRVKNS